MIMKKFIYTSFIFYSLFFIGILHAQVPGTWAVNPSDYNYSMQVTCRLNQNCTDLNDDNNAIAAFVGGQCRGVAYTNVTAGGKKLALLVVYSNSIAGEKVIFKGYNNATNSVFQALDTITFNNGDQVGGLNSPYLMTDNYPPTDISLSSYSFLEGVSIGDTIATLSATDKDKGDTFTYTLPAGQLENSKYSISGDRLKANSTYSYVNDPIDTIRITVADNMNCPYSKDILLYLNDQNDPPTDILFPFDSLHDQDPAGTFVALLTSVDKDPMDTHIYTFSNCTPNINNAAFTIRGDSVFTAAKVLHDITPTFSICIRTTDAGGLYFEKSFQIPVIDSYDPTDITIDTLSMVEGNSSNFYISKIKTLDKDTVTSFTYELVSGTGDTDNDQFYITGNHLYITTQTNYDVKDKYNFFIRSTDAKGAYIEKAFTLTIKDNPNVSLPLMSGNYISPNDDGKNDYWKIQNVIIYKDFSLKVFDQFGQTVYEKESNYNNEFDGKLNGKSLPDGNYYFIFKNDKKVYKGNITIVN